MYNPISQGQNIQRSRRSTGTSSSTVIRRFKEVAKKQMKSGVRLPKAIAIDEYKGDTDAGTYQLIIADAETHEPLDILPNRRKEYDQGFWFTYSRVCPIRD
ncbi:hypothetical protein [Sporosarcina thermotolerans]|uniref:hypothetical protein n=1 Tax=Sporosarcina thermotolerans TaxID=633404 RepID=UPI003D2F915C